jgi:hypothetical protein
MQDLATAAALTKCKGKNPIRTLGVKVMDMEIPINGRAALSGLF